MLLGFLLLLLLLLLMLSPSQISANLRKALGGNAKDVVDATGALQDPQGPGMACALVLPPQQ